jgi:hypothetical protein
MADKRCPRCHLWNSESALVCDCGFDFTTGTLCRNQTSDRPPVSTSWHIGLSSLGVGLIPIFALAAYLLPKLGQAPPLLPWLLSVMLILPPLYWILYFKRLHRSWARYLMLFMGLTCILEFALIITAFVWRLRNPQ